jgi:hypothetical protein
MSAFLPGEYVSLVLDTGSAEPLRTDSSAPLVQLVLVFCALTICDLVGEYQSFGETCCLHLQGLPGT